VLGFPRGLFLRRRAGGLLGQDLGGREFFLAQPALHGFALFFFELLELFVELELAALFFLCEQVVAG
jgi:hypothetical protein